MSPTAEFIRQCVEKDDYEFSLHADDERLSDGLTIAELEEVLCSCELIEDYPDDPRGPSCLVLGSATGRPLHVVCGLTKQQKLLLITVYRPTMPKWRDEKTRNPRE